MLFVAARTMRLASIAACLITIASFALFVVGQTSSASAHQQGVLNGQAAVSSPGAAGSTQPTTAAHPAGSSQKDTAHRVIDEVSNALTSPFSGVTAGWSSQWTIRGVQLLLALALYGFALGFVARVVKARA